MNIKNLIIIESIFMNKKKFKVIYYIFITHENFEFIIIKLNYYHFIIKYLKEEYSWYLYISIIINIKNELFEIKILNTKYNYLNIQYINY